MKIRGKYQGEGNRLVFFNEADHERVLPISPVSLYDDFLGAYLRKYTTAENTTSFWKTVETNLNAAIALVDDAVNGVAGIVLDADDNAEIGALYFGDNLCLSIKQGLIFETRLTFHVLPTTGTETVQAVFGLASAHNATLDSVATNAWFRVESAAKTALLWECDNGDVDDDDNDASTVLAADTFHVFRIDCQNTAAIRFYVDGALVGTGDLSATLSDGEALVQPYFNMSKAHSSANTGTGTMYIDYVRCWQNRS